MPKSLSASNSNLNLVYNATPWPNVADNAASSPLTNIAVRLHTAPLTPSATQATNETPYTNYVGVNTPRTSSGWTPATAGQTSNVSSIDFAQCGATGSTITSASTGRALTGGSIPFHYGDLNSPIAVSNQIQPRFAIGAFVISEA